MSSPSVTGKKAQVPHAPDVETLPLAYWSFSVSACTKQSNMEKSLGVLSSSSHPARAAKS
jgi:hypothetical protein